MSYPLCNRDGSCIAGCDEKQTMSNAATNTNQTDVPVVQGVISISSLPVIQAPKHMQRYVVWNNDGGGRIFLLVGYCPDTLPYFLGMVVDAQKTFPDLKKPQHGNVRG